MRNIQNEIIELIEGLAEALLLLWEAYAEGSKHQSMKRLKHIATYTLQKISAIKAALENNDDENDIKIF